MATHDECPICLDCMDSGIPESLKVSTCKHTFHKKCIDSWIDTAQWKCPICRQQLTEVLRYPLRVQEIRGEKVNVYPVKFNDAMYLIKEVDYVTIRNTLYPLAAQSPFDAIFDQICVSVVMFSLIKSKSLQEAYTRSKQIIDNAGG